MEFLIRGEKIKVTDSIKNYIEEKLGRLNKYFDAPDSIKATALIKVKDNEEIIEVTIPTTKFTLRAEEKNKDLYAAIDLVTDKLERQIRKNKTRLKAKYKKEVLPDFIFDFEVTEEENEDKIVKRKKIDVKPMDEEEAILQMELLGHEFYMYKDSESGKSAVVYKRKDGNYGVIESE